MELFYFHSKKRYVRHFELHLSQIFTGTVPGTSSCGTASAGACCVRCVTVELVCTYALTCTPVCVRQHFLRAKIVLKNAVAAVLNLRSN